MVEMPDSRTGSTERCMSDSESCLMTLTTFPLPTPTGPLLALNFCDYAFSS